MVGQRALSGRLRRGRLIGLVGFLVLAAAGSITAGIVLSNRSGQAYAEAAGVATVVCPDVAGQLPAVPAAAAAEVSRNLAALETQIAEADQRLASSVGEGGPNFAQNAVLGPLADKRGATIERIAIAIGRHAEQPTGLEALAECSLSEAAGTG